MEKKLGMLQTEGKEAEEDIIRPSIRSEVDPPMKRQDPLVIMMCPKNGAHHICLQKKKNDVPIAGRIAACSRSRRGYTRILFTAVCNFKMLSTTFAWELQPSFGLSQFPF